MKTHEGVEVQLFHSSTRKEKQVNGQVDARFPFSPEYINISIEQEAVWVPKSSQTPRGRENHLTPVGKQTPIHRQSSQ
jgi:hypothetical protein